MIVDCHTHINGGADNAGIAEHLEAVENVDKCFVLATVDGSSEGCNKRLSEYIVKHKEKMIGFGVVDPTKDGVSVKHLGSLRDKLGLEGVVLYCSGCGFHPAHSRAMRLYEAAEELEVPVFFHNGEPLSADGVLDYAQPVLLDEVARNFEGLKIVVGNMGEPFLEQTLLLVSRRKNVYADLTIRPSNVWHVYNVVVAAYEAGVMDKLLFGSGYPLGSAGECMETLLGFNKLLADTNLPTVPRGAIRSIIERDTLELLGLRSESA